MHVYILAICYNPEVAYFGHGPLIEPSKSHQGSQVAAFSPCKLQKASICDYRVRVLKTQGFGLLLKQKACKICNLQPQNMACKKALIACIVELPLLRYFEAI